MINAVSNELVDPTERRSTRYRVGTRQLAEWREGRAKRDAERKRLQAIETRRRDAAGTLAWAKAHADAICRIVSTMAAGPEGIAT